MTVSSMWIGSAITGLFSTSSTVIGLPWNTAPGWAHAFSRWCTAIRANAAAS